MNVCFTLEELALMGAYHPENGHLAMITTLTEELPYVGDELTGETMQSTLDKLHSMDDAEYSRQNFMTNVFD